eukprot:11173851-Lingulodinium_polyedra.AAC.1
MLGCNNARCPSLALSTACQHQTTSSTQATGCPQSPTPSWKRWGACFLNLLQLFSKLKRTF